ncbi:MAG: glycosyltransferase family 1 protein [Proteobacteria bacterium]|nr:MAG: glycosyltransferase family 1 protein [Pseudomonadota bacterium]
MQKLPILTFNHHESYLCALAGLDEKFDVVTRYKALDLSWNVRARDVPSNMSLRSFDEIKDTLRQDGYHTVICHTIKTLFWLLPYCRKNLVFVEHIPLFKNTLIQRIKGACKRFIILFWQKVFGARIVAITDFKKASWAVDAVVAKNFPVPFPAELIAREKSSDVRGAYVGNRIQERGTELGWPLLASLLPHIPLVVIGNNPMIPGAYVPRDFKDFVDQFTRCHFYVYPIEAQDGDGFNLSMLEAMQLGLPVVTIKNPTSPIQHEVNGLVARDGAEMISHIQKLCEDASLRLRLGAEARRTIEQEFSPRSFLQVWARVLAEIPRNGVAS